MRSLPRHIRKLLHVACILEFWDGTLLATGVYARLHKHKHDCFCHCVTTYNWGQLASYRMLQVNPAILDIFYRKLEQALSAVIPHAVDYCCFPAA